MAKLTQSKIMSVLDWAYDKAIAGVPGLDSAIELAKDYMQDDASIHENVNSLIRWQNAKAGTSGFITGLGGVLTLPVAIPANISSVMYVQVRMCAAIAHMGGHDVRNDRVKSLVYVCLVGNGAKDIIKEAGIQIGKKMATQAIKNISREVVVNINQKVGFRLLTKFGEKGLLNLGKAVPVLGGVIGGTADLFATNVIGNVARDTFRGEE